MTTDSTTFVSKYAKELANDNAAVFIGAGLSKAAGYVDWPGLLDPVAKELCLDVKKENDLVALAQYYVNKRGANKHQLSQLLIEDFSDLQEPTENHRILARLPIRTFWTTNYDTMIENVLQSAGKIADVKYTREQLTSTKPRRDVVVYKMHGDVNHPSSAVLTKDDYEGYHRTHEAFITALSGSLVSTTFCFLGFSFNDPNLDYVLGRIRTTFAKHQRAHCCITKRRSRKEFSSKAQFDYAVIKQQLVTEDLLRFNIETVFVDQYSNITDLLREVEKRHRVRTVFISGSAHDYGSWRRQAAHEFIAQLASELIRKKFKITTGFGLGVGGPLVTVAVQSIYSQRLGGIEDQLVMRPFPIEIADPTQRQRTYERYREDIIAQAGIAIFLFGNKLDGGKVIEANGVEAEFELAKKRGLWLIPVGASGFVAEKLWRHVLPLYNSYYKDAPRTLLGLLESLGDSTLSPSDLIKVVIEIVELLSKE
jgi:Sir2- and TIR-associating SLOG family/SIR2-like domain